MKVSPTPPDLSLQVNTHVNGMTRESSPSKVIPHVDRSKADPGNVRAGEAMEEMFIEYMMKVMRETVPKSEFSSPATEIYQSMLDSEYSQKAARAGGIGLADMVIAYLESQRYNQRVGGSHEGQPNRNKPSPGQ